MTKRLTIVCIAFFAFQTVFGQKSRADRYFEKGDYTNAAIHYEEVIAKGRLKKDIENIAVSYYNTFQYRAAARYLKLLVRGKFGEKDKTYNNEYNFKLYQVLSALGDYEAGLDYLKRYKENNSALFDTNESIGVIEEFKLKNPDYNVKKVGFNSPASDFGAVKQGDSVYFTSDRNNKQLLSKTYKWTHQPFLDIYLTQVDEKNNAIGSVTALPKYINSKLHEGNFCFSKSGDTLYISRSNITDGKKEFNEKKGNDIHLYKTTKIKGRWGKLEKLLFNKSGFSYQHPALSPDGKKLYFSSNIEGGCGSFDLYYVDLKADEIGEPINLGATINTENREHFPFISEKGHLFFSSNGHLGIGMLDNFVSELVNGDYTVPVNLGAPVNSQYDDFNLNYYSDDEGFFASNRNKTDDDIFQFKQIGEIFIKEYINTFEVRDAKTKAFIPNSKVVLLDKKKKTLYKNTLDSLAFFNINLLASSYDFEGESKGYYSKKIVVKVAERQGQKHILYLTKIPPPLPVIEDPIEVVIAEKKIDINLKENDPERFALLTDIEGPPVVEKEGKLFFQLAPIYFDFDMWNIRTDSRKTLDELAAKLERFPKVNLKISSHTDSRGTVRYNQILSERRAESTRNYLALEGYVNARRMKFQGYGELVPIVPCPMLNCTDEEHQLNRRSEFEIIEY